MNDSTNFTRIFFSLSSPFQSLCAILSISNSQTFLKISCSKGHRTCRIETRRNLADFCPVAKSRQPHSVAARNLRRENTLVRRTQNLTLHAYCSEIMLLHRVLQEIMTRAFRGRDGVALLLQDLVGIKTKTSRPRGDNL